jgi:DNA-binding response OmpR family regulator
MNTTPKILLVEDDPSICEAISEVLQMEGIEVRIAPNGKAGIEELRAGYHPELILLDLMMPGTDGMWFCAEREKDTEIKKIPVVIMSAHGQVENRTAGLSVNAVLKKPIGLDDLLATVKPFLSAH